MHVAIQSESAWLAAPRYALTGAWTAPPRHVTTPPVDGLSGDCVCGCHGECSGALLGALGDASGVTPEIALQQAIGSESSPDFSASAWISAAVSYIRAGAVPAQNFSANCSNQPAPNLNLFATASGLALSTSATASGIAVATGTITAATGAIIGAATMGAGAIVSVIAAIFAHHAAAVKQEQQLGCAAIAAANNALAVIDSAVAGGQTTPQAAASALDALMGQIGQYVDPAVKHSPCNANCELLVLYRAIVIYRKAMYSGMVAVGASAGGEITGTVLTPSGGTYQTTVPGASATPGAGSSIDGMPTWVWLAAAGIAAVTVLR